MSSSTPPDVEANEETTLLGNTSEASPSSGITTATAPAEAERLLEEMDLPWPSTFERSVSLLASPIINPQAALHFTKSPKPGNTPLALRRYAVRFNYHLFGDVVKTMVEVLI
jgi:hypothetical protein